MQASLVSKKVNLSISAELLAQIDALAKRDYTSRSGILRMALLEYVRKPGNATKLQAAPGEDVELKQFLADYKQAHTDTELL